jgi:hypothetical protein
LTATLNQLDRKRGGLTRYARCRILLNRPGPGGFRVRCRGVISITVDSCDFSKIDPSDAKESPMTANQMSKTRAETPKSELTEQQLDKVCGGAVAPRDAASGMATGRRSH